MSDERVRRQTERWFVFVCLSRIFCFSTGDGDDVRANEMLVPCVYVFGLAALSFPLCAMRPAAAVLQDAAVASCSTDAGVTQYSSQCQATLCRSFALAEADRGGTVRLSTVLLPVLPLALSTAAAIEQQPLKLLASSLLQPASLPPPPMEAPLSQANRAWCVEEEEEVRREDRATVCCSDCRMKLNEEWLVGVSFV